MLPHNSHLKRNDNATEPGLKEKTFYTTYSPTKIIFRKSKLSRCLGKLDTNNGAALVKKKTVSWPLENNVRSLQKYELQVHFELFSCLVSVLVHAKCILEGLLTFG